MTLAHLFTRKLIFGLTLVALVVMAGMLVWATPGERVHDGLDVGVDNSRPKPGSLVGAREAEESGLATQSSVADRHAVEPPSEAATGTALRVRVIRRGTGEPVRRFPLTLIPETAVLMPSGYDVLEGTTDDEGEVLWEDVEWDRVAIFPAPQREFFDLEPRRLNERVHEVGVAFMIDGEVVDPRGRPVAGSTIWTFFDDSSFRGLRQASVTDGGGRFSLPVLGSTGVYVFARSQRRAPSRVALVRRVEDGQTVGLRLGLGDEAGVIVGDVVTHTGLPIAEATVRVINSTVHLPIQQDPSVAIGSRDFNLPSSLQRTDVSGRFRVGGVAAGEATVTVTARGWAGTAVKVDVIPGGTSRTHIMLQRGARVLGSMLDTNGDPVPDVTVLARRHDFAMRKAITDKQGRYALEHVQTGGKVILEAMHPDRGYKMDGIELADGQEYRWEPVFSAGATIRGQIQNHKGTALGGIWVGIDGEDGDSRQGRSERDGRFIFLQCGDQAYELSVAVPGFSRKTIAEGIRPGGEERVYRLAEMPVPDAHLVGRVLDSEGNPAVPCRIYAYETELGAYVESELDAVDGTFRLGPMVSGEWTLTAEHTRFPKLEQYVRVPAGTVTDLGEIRLEERVRAEVVVRKPIGVIDDGISGRLWGPGFDGDRLRVESGRVVLPPLKVGDYTLEIVGEATAREVREFELVAGQEKHLEVNLRPGTRRAIQVDLPGEFERELLTFTTFEASGLELASWRMYWYSSWDAISLTFRPEAVRLVVTSDNGNGEAQLESEDIRVRIR